MINKKKKVGDIKCFKESHLLPSHRFAFFNISLEKSILNCMPLSDIKQCITIYVCVNPQCNQFLFCTLHKFQGNRVHELNLKDPKDLYLTYMMLILGIIINSNTHCDILFSFIIKIYSGYLYAGKHEKVWYASDFPSGLYLISLVLDKQIINTSKVSLIK